MSDARRNAVDPCERIGSLLVGATPSASLQEHLEGRARLIAAIDRLRKQSRVRSTLFALAFASAVGAGALALLVRSHPPAPLVWRVESGEVGAQTYGGVSAAGVSARLVFDDGSDVTLAPGSRGRVAGTTPVGAEVVLEQGRAHVRVKHRDRTQWMLDAGPFSLNVKGTEFSVAWMAETETLDVWMHTGRVVVTGPLLGDSLPLSAEQHVRVRLGDGMVQIDRASEAPAVAHEAPETAAAGSTSSAVRLEGSPRTAPPSQSGIPSAVPSWSKLVAAGEFSRVVREAEADPGRATSSRPLSDLRALGDAARYEGNAALANRAYLAVRERFSSSAEARAAAFLLGRVAEEQLHASADAIRWYDAYMQEAAGGPFAGDALGRKMSLVAASQGRETARPFAAAYLKGYPRGPYATVARDLAP
jgi:FecR protein